MAPRLLLCALVALVAVPAAAGSPSAPAVDAAAMAEAIAASREGGPRASAWAYGYYLQGRLALERGDLPAAREALRAARIHDPDSLILAEELSRVEARLGGGGVGGSARSAPQEPAP